MERFAQAPEHFADHCRRVGDEDDAECRASDDEEFGRLQQYPGVASFEEVPAKYRSKNQADSEECQHSAKGFQSGGFKLPCIQFPPRWTARARLSMVLNRRETSGMSRQI
jgi:hypothetical protein